MSKRKIIEAVEAIGISFTDVGKSVFGGVHMTGKAILNAFGASGAANSLEKTEANAGLLPSWAQTSKPVTQVAVVSPQYVAVVPQSGKTAVFVADSVLIFGGTRFDGDGKKYSFGYNTPSKIVAAYKGQSTPYDGVSQVLFLGGTEGQPQTSTLANSTQDLLDSAGQVVKVATTYKAPTSSPPSKTPSGTSSSAPSSPSSSVQLSQPALSAPAASSPSVSNFQLTAPTLSGDALGRQIVGELEAAEAVGMSFTDVLENVFTGGAVYTSQAAEKGLFGGGGGGGGPTSYNFNTDPTKFHPQAYTPSAYSSGQLSTAASRLASLRQQLAQAQQQRMQQSMAQAQPTSAPASTPFSPLASLPVVQSQSSAQPLPASSTSDSGDDGGTNSSIIGRSADMGRNRDYEVLGRQREGSIDYKTINEEGGRTVDYAVLGADHARRVAATKAAKHIVGADEGEFSEPYEVEIVGGEGSAPANPYLKGTQVLGAVANIPKLPSSGAPRLPGVPSVGYKIATAPATGRTFTTVHVMQQANGKKPDPKTSIANARTIAKRAASDASKIKSSVAKLAAAKVHGIGSDDDGWVEIVGAVAAGRKPKMTVAQIQQAADKLKASAGDLNTQADKHEKLLSTYNSKLTAGVKKIQTITNPRASVGIKGDDVLGAISHAHDVLGHDYLRALDDAMVHSHRTIVGQAYYPPAGIDPTTGLPISSSSGIDPATGMPYSSEGYGTGAIDPTTGLPMDSSSELPGPPDYGLGVPPTGAPPLVPGQDYTPDPGAQGDVSTYSSTGGGVPLPVGAVIYTDDGGHAMGTKSVGSYGYFFQGVPGEKSRDGNGSGYIVRGVKNGVLNWKAYVKSANANNDKSLGAAEAASLPTMAANSVTNNWGPLIGNPADPNFKNLRYDVGGNQWFWFYDKAPPWATAADTMNRYNQAITDYKTQLTAAQDNYLAQQAQDQLDAQNAAAMATQQATEDSQAQHQADLAQIQAQAAQPALDQQNQQAQLQMEQQAQQYQMQMAQQQAQMQLAQQQADIQSQQDMAAFAQANPQVYAQMVNAQQQAPDQGGGYGGDQGGYGNQFSDDGGFGGGYGDGSEPGDDGSIDWGDSGSGSSRDVAELEDSDL